MPAENVAFGVICHNRDDERGDAIVTRAMRRVDERKETAMMVVSKGQRTVASRG